MTLFHSVLRMSLTASYAILVVMLIRLPLKKAPKIISYALWSVVGFRLVCPVSFRSFFSLFPPQAVSVTGNLISVQTASADLPAVASSFSAAHPLPSPATVSAETITTHQLNTAINIGAYLWLCGIAAMLLYAMGSSWILRHRLCGAHSIAKGIRVSENLRTPFVFGVFKPVIYLPSTLSEKEKIYIIRHEETHIRRHDPAIKLLAFLILSIHWFNPLVWASFALMSTDMELSCDERVIRELGCGMKKDYSESMLSLATGTHLPNGGLLAFGEGNVRRRIKNVLNYNKPAFWVAAGGCIVAAVTAIGLAANPSGNGSTGNAGYESRTQPVTLTNFPVAEGDAVLTGGRKINVQLVMTDGTYFDDRHTDPGGGIYPENYRGSYEIRVFDSAGKLLSSAALHEADGETDMNFPGKFRLQFADYNRDGSPDFTVGQWFTSAARAYRIFTVSPVGAVRDIGCKADPTQDCNYTDAATCSVKFDTDGNSGFYTVNYNNAAEKPGECWEKAHYVWNRNTDSFQFDGVTKRAAERESLLR